MYKNILVPVVLGDGQDNKKSLEAARLLADADADVILLHVREPIPAFVAAEIPEDVLAATQREFQEDIERAAAEYPGAKPVLISGHAGRGIVEYADANNIDCIILASHRPGLQNLLLGSTANRVVHHATCSVHVIR